jgi:predicted RNA-binding protein
MSTRTYWLDLFTGTTWQEFLDSGAQVSGFRDARWKTVEQIKPGDYLLCYLTGISRWIGVLEVTSEAFMDATPIWKDATFPCRVRVKPVVTLSPETAVPVYDLRDQFSVFQNLSNPFAWTGHFRGSPARWKAVDGDVVVKAMTEAEQNPQIRAVDKAKLKRRPKALRANKLGEVTVPEPEEVVPPATLPQQHVDEVTRETSLHTEVQGLLLRLGSDMGLEVWVARNDRGRGVNGHTFSGLSRMKSDLPLQFDEATNRTIELIDVLWLKGNAIVAAFEIECTTPSTRACSGWRT